MIKPEEHIGLIVSVAKKLVQNPRYSRVFGTDIKGFYGPLYLGLADAIKNFNPDIGKFSTYATQCMIDRIKTETNDMDFMPVRNHTLRNDINKERKGRHSKETRERGNRAIACEVSTIDNYDVFTLNNFIDHEELFAALKLLKHNNIRCYYIIRRFFGINCEQWTLNRIADRLGIDSNYVSVLKRKGLKFLQENINANTNCN